MGKKIKIVTISGARPQFIKASTISPILKRNGFNEIFVHTGQHYDYEMSEIFFKGLNLPKPKYNLGIGSHLHGKQTALMLQGIEEILIEEKPRLVIVYGDTNTTLSGALAAAKLHIPIAHIESGLRSFDRKMPEEINRVVTDHLSTLLFAPTKVALQNLKKEGIKKGVYLVGDVMYDLFIRTKNLFNRRKEKVLKAFGLKEKEFCFATVHRAENTGNQVRWKNIIEGLCSLSKRGIPIVWPAHPRTKDLLSNSKVKNLQIVAPIPYVETQILIGSSKMVITDSGGLQKEASFHRTPCLILRDRTEWTELINLGCAFLVDDSKEKLIEKALQNDFPKKVSIGKYYGNGRSSEKIVNILSEYLS